MYRLEYQLSGPLTSIFTHDHQARAPPGGAAGPSTPASAMAKYQRIHLLLWRLKRVEHALGHSWSVLKTQTERKLHLLGRGARRQDNHQ